MRFAHLADCHIGGWREPKLRDLGLKSFEAALTICVQEKVDFILISGDLFDTALPPLDLVKRVTYLLKEMDSRGMKVYVIPGSHDYSVTGKTMIDVFEKAGLVKNVMRFENGKFALTQDKGNVIIGGIGGKRGGREVEDYKKLRLDVSGLPGFKIFMFHSLLTEFKGKDLEKVESLDLKWLPKGFNYYAGGHPHFVQTKQVGQGIVAYPGPVFPNNFKELSELKYGGFNIVNVTDKVSVQNKLLDLIGVVYHVVDVTGKSALDVEEELMNINDFEGKILMLRFVGVLESGKVSDIRFKEIEKKFKGAYLFLKNIAGLGSKEGSVDVNKSVEVEDSFMKGLMDVLNVSKSEGERNANFEERVLESVSKYLGVEL